MKVKAGSLIEVLISIFILTIMGSILLNNYIKINENRLILDEYKKMNKIANHVVVTEDTSYIDKDYTVKITKKNYNSSFQLVRVEVSSINNEKIVSIQCIKEKED